MKLTGEPGDTNPSPLPDVHVVHSQAQPSEESHVGVPLSDRARGTKENAQGEGYNQGTRSFNQD